MNPILDPGAIDDLRRRLATTRFAAPTDSSWVRGVPADWLGELIQDWQAFDFEAFQQRLTASTHLTAEIDGQSIHVLTAVGNAPDPLPLLLTNGWPSSFCEYQNLIPLLTDPGAHGADPADAFTVVVPALPGFGFSAPPPPGGFVAAEVAMLWARLMSDEFGFARYVAHGSDLGAGVTAQLARIAPEAVAAIHLATPGLPLPPKPWTNGVQEFADAASTWTAEEGSYAHQHSTRPFTVAAGLLDSPIGLAAWIGEKVITWSPETSSGTTTFPRRMLLETLTLYWLTGTIGTSMLPYWSHRHTDNAALPPGDPSPVPTAIGVFGGERVPFPYPPRELADHYFTVTDYRTHDVGGHFPAAAEPELLATALRETFRPYRDHR